MSSSASSAPAFPQDIGFKRYIESKPLPPLPDMLPETLSSVSVVSCPPTSTAAGTSRARIRMWPRRPRSEVFTSTPPTYDEAAAGRSSLDSSARPQQLSAPTYRTRPRSEIFHSSPPSYDEATAGRPSLDGMRSRQPSAPSPLHRPSLLPTYPDSMRQSSESQRTLSDQHRLHHFCQCGSASCPGGELARRSHRR